MRKLIKSMSNLHYTSTPVFDCASLNNVVSEGMDKFNNALYQRKHVYQIATTVQRVSYIFAGAVEPTLDTTGDDVALKCCKMFPPFGSRGQLENESRRQKFVSAVCIPRLDRG